MIKTFTLQNTDKFIVTGITTRGKRFKIETDNYFYAMGINLYKGNVWLLRDGHRNLIKSVNN